MAAAAADAAAEERAYFIDKVKLVPIDIQPELKVPENYTEVWEPEVQWDLTVAQLTKTVSTTDLSGANITTADGTLLWQIFVDSDLANQEIIDTIGNGHELVLDAQHPLTIGDYAKDKDGNYAYVGTPVTCTSFLEAGSKEAGIFEGKAVGSSKQYVISLGEKTGKTMITYYTQINGTTESLVNKAEFWAEGFGDGTTLPYQKTFTMRSTFLAKESHINTGYKTKVNKQPTVDRPGLDSNEVQTLKNTVTLTGGPIVSGVTADSSVKITAGKISKSGSKDVDFGRSHLVTWEIVVNKNLADLSQADGDKIVIRDDLELGLQYMEDPTVQKFTKTKTAADGTIVPDGLEEANLSGEWADYDQETRRLTFTLLRKTCARPAISSATRPA